MNGCNDIKALIKVLYLVGSELEVRRVEAVLGLGATPARLLWARNRAEYLAGLAHPDLDLVLSDRAVDGYDGLSALAACRAMHPGLPFILLARLEEEAALDCLRQGATDWLPREGLGRLPLAMGRALAEVRERRALSGAEAALLACQARLVRSQKVSTTSLLVSGLCHDFNNLVAAIAGCAASLALQAAPGEPQDTVATILGATERCQELVRQLLGFAREGQDPRPGLRTLNSLAEEAHSLLAHVHPKEVRLELDLYPVPAAARVDPGQIVQVLLNLGFNALDALAGPGTVTLRTGRQRVAAGTAAGPCPPGAYVFLEVEDDGCGMPPSVLERIYEPFFSTKPSGQGTGLGLATAQAIARQHGGFLLCHSEPGRGTRFRLLLPEMPLPAPDAGGPGPGRPLRVLLVEDAEPDAILVLEALRDFGFAPRHLRVETGPDMARALAGPAWDVILADHFMPRFDGFSALALARELAPELPFLFVSGAAGDAFTAMALRGGARDCVAKHRLDLLGPSLERHLAIPTADAPAQAGAGHEPAATLLLADDDPLFRAGWAGAIRRAFRVEVLEACDGSEAVRVFGQHAESIGLVILDRAMPGLRGPEAFAAIRGIRPGAKGILCSGDPEEALRAAVRDHGFLAYLKKPFQLRDLESALRGAGVLD